MVKGGNGRVLESGPDDEVFINYSEYSNIIIILLSIKKFKIFYIIF